MLCISIYFIQSQPFILDLFIIYLYCRLYNNLRGTIISIVPVLSGSQPLASLVTTIPPEAYGLARGLNVKSFGSKRMLHLEPPGEAAICTMVLCHRNQTLLSELKVNMD